MIFLSGAGGFLASHILEQGLNKNRNIVCQYRSLRPRSYLFSVKDKLNTYQMDLNSGELPADLLKDCNVVINTTGNTTTASPEQSEQDNINATKNLYYAAAKARVKHWVQISSIATLCNGKTDLIDESFINQPRNTFYAKNKNSCDAWLRAQTAIPQLTIVYPTFMLGAWDSKPSSGGILLAMRMKKLNTFTEATKNFVAASDVACGIWDIVDKNFKGSVILGGKNILISEFVDKVCQVFDLPQDAFKITKSPATNIEFCQASAVDTSFAKKAIGFESKQDMTQMINEAFNYFKKNKMIV